MVGIATTVGELARPLMLAIGAVLDADLEGQRWRERAACRGADTNLFFPDRGAAVAPAIAYCKRCTVREPCLQCALSLGGDSQIQGIWGGVSTGTGVWTADGSWPLRRSPASTATADLPRHQVTLALRPLP